MQNHSVLYCWCLVLYSSLDDLVICFFSCVDIDHLKYMNMWYEHDVIDCEDIDDVDGIGH